MSAQQQPRLTPEQYLELDRASEFRNDYYKGRMYPTGGPICRETGAIPNAIIIGNLTFAIRGATTHQDCLILSSVARVRVSPSGLYTYPDIVVVCGEPQYVDGRKDTLTNPTLVAEVLSPSTEAYDHGFKSVQYRTLESLQEYVLVSQDEPRIEVFRRQAGGNWLLSESAGRDASCTLESLACSVQLKDIYSEVTFATEE
jgi:Uma2 family endonuclease